MDDKRWELKTNIVLFVPTHFSRVHIRENQTIDKHTRLLLRYLILTHSAVYSGREDL